MKKRIIFNSLIVPCTTSLQSYHYSFPKLASNLFIGSTKIELEQTDSTNNYARTLVHDKLPLEGTLIVADEQFQGRGQRSNSWVSEAGLNLTCSYILRPVFLAAKDQFLLSAVTALAVADVVASFLGDEKEVKIKWPNDILVDGEKIAGILIENTLRGTQLETSIVGVGLNVNQVEFPKEIMATSLQLLLEKETSISDVLELLNQKLEKYYLTLRNGGFSPLMEMMNERLFGRNEKLNLEINGTETEVEILQVMPSGQLELLRNDGQITLHMHHEIDWMR